MATCNGRRLVEAKQLSNYNSIIQHSSYESPLSSTMGSVSSLLNDSGYRGSSTYQNGGSVSADKDCPVYEDLELGPPEITPVSGKLEKNKEKRLIKPIAVHPITPIKRGPTTPPNKRGPATPDNIAGLPRVPDVVSGAETYRDNISPSATQYAPARSRSGGTHYAPARSYPIKSQSLQDIKYVNSGKRSSISSVNQLGELKPSLKRAPFSQSLNQLNFNYNHSHSQLNGLKGLDYRRVSRTSQSSHNSDQGKNLPSSVPMQDLRRHSNASVASGHVSADYRTNNMQGDTSSHVSSHVSSRVVMEENEMETIYDLKRKIQEQESQIALLRHTMEKNEQIIFKVYEEKQQNWDDEMEEMREDLKEAEDKMYNMEQSLRRQLYQLEQDKKRLQKELEKMKGEKEMMQRKIECQKDEQTSYVCQTEEAKWQLCQKSGEISLLKSQLKESKGELGQKMNEIVTMKSQIKDIKTAVTAKENELEMLKERLSEKDSQLSQRGTEISTLEKRFKRESKQEISNISLEIEQLKMKLCQKENELSAEKFEVLQLQEMNEESDKKLKGKEEELASLHETLSHKDHELSQEKCEVSYLQEVQEKLSQQILEKNSQIVTLQDHLKQMSGNHHEIIALQEKLYQKERELTACEEQLGHVQSEKDSEMTTLHRRLSQKECEITALQTKLNQTDREKSTLHTKVARLKESNSQNDTQKQLEQDFTRLQVQVTKQERLLLEQNSEMSLLKLKHDNELKGLKASLLQHEKDGKMWQEKLVQKDGETRNIWEKLTSRETELAELVRKIKQYEEHELDVQSQNVSLAQEVSDLKEGLETLQNEKVSLEMHLRNTRSENVNLQHKFDKVTNEVRSLKNQLDASLHNGFIGQSDDLNEQTNSVVVDNLKFEVQRLKTELKKSQDSLDEQQSAFVRERVVWQSEKEKVISYQKQLQLNYIQMFRKNKNLEKEVQHLSVELERRDMNEFVDHV